MGEVVWADEALANIEAIEAYIAGFAPLAARRLIQRLIEAGDSLANFPERGRLVVEDVREMVIVPPYILRYQVSGERVIILRVRHAARDEAG